ncbi:mechanosensitive ion channel family protein [Pontibacter sp. G13]|uniref:mechanosensitive ion channel family protein n=1 Tax=Pontibacter sp. G13 TaxID=3074898 RepID=UPI002889BC2E|nr:mechanosensitive ion channel family protein [Pontibacter sp. G13]WNJ20190.1 mechanosensitive ion channel family protein [Pontibacter sp. G13]
MKISVISRWLSIAFWCVVSVSTLMAQPEPEAPATVEYGLSNPRATISRHLYYLTNDYQPELSADALFGKGKKPEELKRLALMLRDIYDAKGNYVDVELIPDETDYVDSLTGKHRYVVFPSIYPRIYVEKYGNEWRYSRETVAAIPEIHAAVVPDMAEFLMKLSPGIAKRDFLGLKAWQWEGAIFTILFILLFYWSLNKLFGWIIRRVIPRFVPPQALDTEMIPPVVHPLSWFLIVLVLREFFLPGLLLPISVGKFIGIGLRVLAPVFGVMVFYNLVDLVAAIAERLADKTETTMDNQLVPLLRKAAKMIVVVFGIIFILQNLDVNVTALLAGVSIGGLALALAAQDTVKNFIGSVSIFVDRPFLIGDYIDTGSFAGTVVEVGIRSTRIQEIGGALVSVPNGHLADMTITNHGVRTYRRYSTTITITYDTPVEKIAPFVEGIRNIALSHELVQDDSVIVQFHEMSSSSLDIFFAARFMVTAYDGWLKGRQEVLIEIMKLAESSGISFAFPSTSVYVESMPGNQQGLPGTVQ